MPLFEGQAEGIEIEPLELCRISRTQHDVIDPNNIEGCWHDRLLFKTQLSVVAGGVMFDGARLNIDGNFPSLLLPSP